jgi:Domain of unknown function (DUF4224)
VELLLTADVLFALTEAKTRPAQMAWLDARGFHYEVGAKGGIKVLRAHVECKMGGRDEGPAPLGPDLKFFEHRA